MTRCTCCGLPVRIRGRSCGLPAWCCRRVPTGSWPGSWGCPPAGRRSRGVARGGGPGAGAPGPPGLPGAPDLACGGLGDGGAVLAVCRLLGSPVPQRFDERGHVTPVLGRQLVDAGDQEFPFLVAWMLLPGGGLVVV